MGVKNNDNLGLTPVFPFCRIVMYERCCVPHQFARI